MNSPRHQDKGTDLAAPKPSATTDTANPPKSAPPTTKDEIEAIFAEVGRIYRTDNLTQLDLEKLEQQVTNVTALITKAETAARREGAIAELNRMDFTPSITQETWHEIRDERLAALEPEDTHGS